VFSFEDSIPYTFEILLNILDVWERFLFILKTVTFGFNNRVNESLGIAVELLITSHVTNFIEQILSFLAYGGNSTVKTQN
jgi:hypothetical protein